MNLINKRLKIAVVLASMSAEYAYKTLIGIEEAAKKNNADIFLFNSNATTDEKLKHNIGEYNIYHLIDFSQFDGVILFANLIQGYSAYNYIIDKIRQSKVPTVSIDADIDGFYFVGVENYEPMKKIVDHLIEVHNYTDIACFAGQDFNSDNRERFAAYLDSLREHGIKVGKNRLFKGAFTNAYGRQFARELLNDRDNLPQAVVCCTDSMAIGARTVFESAGLNMPGDIAFAGFDDLFESSNTIPRITTVSRNLDVVGREAVNRIVSHIKGEHVKMKERFPATPVFRESCGCCPEDDSDIEALRSKYLETSAQYIKYLAESNLMMENLTLCTNYQEFIDKLTPFIQRTFEGDFYLCLNKEYIKELVENDGGDEKSYEEYRSDGYADEMSVVIHTHKGVLQKSFDFLSKDILPEIDDSQSRYHTYIFSPLHFRDRCMGYAVMDNCTFPTMGPMFNTWLINLCNCMESLRKQIHLHNVVEYLDKVYVLDALTGLNNRYGFDRYTEKSFTNCKICGKTFMLLFADVDGLKEINDKYGHDQGDFAITTIADSLVGATTDAEVCARYGGDEFVVYAESFTENDAISFIDRFQRNLDKANSEIRKPYTLSASCGYVIAAPDENDILNHYIDMADNCMYVQKMNRKQNSKNSY